MAKRSYGGDVSSLSVDPPVAGQGCRLELTPFIRFWSSGGGATPDAGVPGEISGLALWLRADSGAYNDAGSTLATNGQTVQQWNDKSGNGRNASQSTSGYRPLYNTNVLNGEPVITFDGSDDILEFASNFADSFTAAEIFIIVKIDTDPPGGGGQAGLWDFSGHTSGSGDTHYPWTDGIIYDSFGTTSRKTTINPSDSLTSWRLYNASSSSGDWSSRLDGTLIYNIGSNTVDWRATAHKIGGSDYGGTYRLDGQIAEVIMYDKVLSTSERVSLIDYFVGRYGLTLSGGSNGGTLMTTSFTFDSDSESWVTMPSVPSDLSLSYDSGVGDPSGSLEIAYNPMSFYTGAPITGYWELVTTWEDLGVPPGDAVTHVRLEYARDRLTSGAESFGGGHIGPYTIYDSAGTTLVATLVPSRSISFAETNWKTRGGSDVSISSPYQDSDTTIRLRVASGIDVSGGYVIHHDQLTYAITHTS